MKLKVQSQKAIEILNKRINDLNSKDFQSTVWKKMVINDLKEIFETGDQKWMQINGIRFGGSTISSLHPIHTNGKNQARQLLKSYIEQINEYASIKTENTAKKENMYRTMYEDLSGQLEKTIPQINDFLAEQQALLADIENKKREIQTLKDNTVQLNNISLLKLFKLLTSLPVGQTYAFLGALLTALGCAFWLGTVVSDTGFKTERYENKIMKEKLFKQIESLEQDFRNASLEADSLKKAIKNTTPSGS